MLGLALSSLFALLACRYVGAVPYNEYILAPSSRTLSPVAVYATNGTVTNAIGVTTSGSGSTIFEGASHITYDFGKNIAGVVSVTVGDVSSPNATLALAYAEGSKYIMSTSSDSLRDGGEAVCMRITNPHCAPSARKGVLQSRQRHD